jgi:cyanophycinase
MKWGFWVIILWSWITSCSEQREIKGSLLIIGGGDRTPAIIQKAIEESHMTDQDYVVILPMAGEEPDTSFEYMAQDFRPFTQARLANLNFSDSTRNRSAMVDSLRHAKLIMICGGDQHVFMQAVRGNEIEQAIWEAYRSGALIAGTSAGAAVMSEVMITGDQKKDTAYSATYAVVEKDNAVYEKGLGFIKDGIIDQHFIVRSRYNRLFTAMADHPGLWGMGIDEATAVWIHGNRAEVVGESQVVWVSGKEDWTWRGEKPGAQHLELSFKLPQAVWSLK